MTETLPAIDFTKMDFPSDKLTIKMIREAWPTTTDTDYEYSFERQPKTRLFRRASLDETVGIGIIDQERELAQWVFKEMLGQPNELRPDNYNKNDIIDSLIEEYIEYKLAHGEHDAAALIQRIEKQAEAQARQFGSPRR